MSEKVCGICGEDCGDRPRVKDRNGRYFCKPCAEARLAKHRKQGAPAAPAVATDEPDDLYQVDPGASPFPIDMLDKVEQPGSCPVCMRSMPPGAKICVSCGYDSAKGIQTSTLIEKRAGKGGRKYRCQNCDYDLKGLKDPVCPECGARVQVSRKAKLREDIARDVLIDEWRKPAIWLGIGLLMMVLYHGATGGIAAAVAYPILLGVQVLVGYAVLWLCFMFLGDIGTPLLNLLRLAGIYAIVDVAWVVCFGVAALLPLFLIGLFVAWVLWLSIYISIFANTFEVDWTDALIVIILTGATKLAIVFAITYYALSPF